MGSSHLNPVSKESFTDNNYCLDMFSNILMNLTTFKATIY